MSAPTEPGERGFSFPGVFEICAMGAADATLEQLVPQVLSTLGLPLIADSLRTRPSSRGNYVAVTVSFRAETRADYDAAHAALRARAEIKWTL